MNNYANTAALIARPIGIALLAVLVFSVLGSNDSIVSAKETRTAVFGTAVNAPTNGELVVVTRGGIITLTITEQTKLDRKRGTLELSDVVSGTSVTGYFTESDDALIAGKLTFRKRNARKEFEHVIGVVVEKKGKKLTVQTTDGDEVEIESSDEPDDDATEQGSLIVTVVETDEETGDMDAKAVRTADQTIERLSKAIGAEISLAQEKLLKARMSETASVHLTRLYETLDTIQAEAQEKIEAAFTEFQATYTTTLDANLIAPPITEITGKVLTRTPNQLVVAANGNGRRSYLAITADVHVELLDGNSGTILNVTPGMFVEVSVITFAKTTGATAQLVKIIPTPEKPGNSSKNNKQTITGTVVLVDNGKSGTQKVIVVDNPDGSDGAAAVTPDTIVTGDIVPGQEVEITLGDDGFSAEEVVVTSDPDSAELTPTPAPPVEYKLLGKIREISDAGIILDDVYLTLDTLSPSTGPLTVGEEIQFTVTVDESGRWVIVGVEP